MQIFVSENGLKNNFGDLSKAWYDYSGCMWKGPLKQVYFCEHAGSPLH